MLNAVAVLKTWGALVAAVAVPKIVPTPGLALFVTVNPDEDAVANVHVPL